MPGQAARQLGGLGQLTNREDRGKLARQPGGEIAGIVQPPPFPDPQEAAPADADTAAAPAATAIGTAQLLDIHQRQLQRQIGMRHKLREADQLPKTFFPAAAPWRFAAADAGAGCESCRSSHLVCAMGCTRSTGSLSRQGEQFPLDGREIARLDLYQRIRSGDIDHETVTIHLAFGARAAIEFLEVAM